MSKPSGNYAVMAQRRDPVDSLDYFPTPPWATRALIRYVINGGVSLSDWQSAWEPAAGSGHMAEVLRESFDSVVASDVHDYGVGYNVGSFVGSGSDVFRPVTRCDWIITNPPFNLAVDFARTAFELSADGVALLVRTAWLESEARYRLFEDMPLDCVALFSGRVPMVKGRWDPKASTATSYCWAVWRKRSPPKDGKARLVWIPPEARRVCTHPDDVQRFAKLGVADAA